MKLQVIAYIAWTASWQGMNLDTAIGRLQAGHGLYPVAQLIINFRLAQPTHRLHMHMSQIGSSAKLPDIRVFNQEP